MTFTQATIVLNYVVDENVYSYFDQSINIWTMLCLSCFGVVTNVLNAVVFIRQGLKDSVSISMMAITCWDLVKCLSGLIHRMYGPLQAISQWVSHIWLTYTYHAEFNSIFAGFVSYALTAYVSVERCLCVSMPLKVRSIVTVKLTLFMVVAISLLTFGAFFVVFFNFDIYYMYYSKFNATAPIFLYSTFYYRMQHFAIPYYSAMAIVLPFTSFIVLSISSSITVYYLRKSSQFIGKTQSASGISLRERRASSMLLVIIAIKIGNLFPRMVVYSAQLVEPEFYSLRHYHYLFLTVTRFLFVLDFANAAVTFFIYLKMSSNFKATFLSLCTRCLRSPSKS
ncbi:G-protein coupled receptor frpr-1 [Biomphalaria glabrata]|nr:G-protein coupled receptor frpr-1 [Biomphalaria glabrata]